MYNGELIIIIIIQGNFIFDGQGRNYHKDDFQILELDLSKLMTTLSVD